MEQKDMNSPKERMQIGDSVWWLTVVMATVGTLLIAISITLATFIGTFHPALAAGLAIAILVTLGLAALLTALRYQPGRS